MSTQAPTNLFSLDHLAMVEYLSSLGEKPYRAKQIMQWLYARGERNIENMSDVSKKLRTRLSAECTTQLPRLTQDHLSADGTCKWLFELSDGNSIETVFIPEKDRGTLCVSSQIGCALDCSFCATARQGFNRNLTVDEIIGQVWLANSLLGSMGTDQRVTNVVMMGMGEPLLNMSALVPSLSLMMDDLGYGLSKRRTTVSTSGVVPAMDRLTDAIDVSLAVSLHAPTNDLRDGLVPINRKYPIDELMAACWRYVRAGTRKKSVLFEYVMLNGVNDNPAEARALAKLLRNFPGKVNLIPFNPFPTSGYERSSRARVERFQSILSGQGILTLTRTTRGDDIDAACGQLAGQVDDRSRRYIKFSEPRFGEHIR